MRLAAAIFVLFVVAPPLMSQTAQTPGTESEGGEYAPAMASAPIVYNYIVPLPSSKSLSPPELAGKKLFIQRCSVCHLPGNPQYLPVAPILDGKIISTMGDAAARQQILHGSPRMPGFQYVFETAEVDKIISYLKLLEYDPSAKKYAYSSAKK